MAKKLIKTVAGVGAIAVAGKVGYNKYKNVKEQFAKEENDSIDAEVKKYNAIFDKKVVEIEDEEFTGCEVKVIGAKAVIDLGLAVFEKDVYINFESMISNVSIILPDGVNVTCDIDKKLAGVHNYVENTDEEGIHTVYIIGKAVLSSVEVIPVNFYVDDEDVEEDFDDDAAFPESDDVEVKVINETKENQEKEDDTEETEDVLEGIEIEDDSDVDKTETINLEEI